MIIYLNEILFNIYGRVGNIAIGNLHQFLPAIVKIAESDPKKRLLSLHALKEAKSMNL